MAPTRDDNRGRSKTPSVEVLSAAGTGDGPDGSRCLATPSPVDSYPADSPDSPDRGDGPDGRHSADSHLAASDPAASYRADSRDPAAVRAFIESFTSQLTQAGFPRTPARIFVALLTSDSSRLSAAELSELLQTSPASVSGGVRYLIQVGLVTAEGEPGSRRQHYRMPTDVWDEIVRLRDRQFARWVTDLRDGVAALGAGTPAGARMADTVRYFEFLSGEMSNLLARWRERAD